ncbi:complement factor H-related protein 1-like [Trachinotus anak]
MYIRYFGFLLLIWFPGALHAQSATQSCSAPSLVGGFFVPKQVTYSNGTTLSYTCYDGRKPAMKGWWATTTCENGKWSHQPQCMDIKACIPPTIPNGKYTENSNGWYEDRDMIRISCDQGFEHKDRVATARCINGEWSSLPVCQKSDNACIEPPKVPHAVISQGYQEVFPADSEVVYECEDGYAIEGAQTSKSILCIAGTWGEGPVCNKVTGTAAGHGASPEVETGGEHTASTGHGRQPATGDASCVMTRGRYDNSIVLSENVFIKEGERKILYCGVPDYFTAVQCSNGRIFYTNCCHSSYFNTCPSREARLLV